MDLSALHIDRLLVQERFNEDGRVLLLDVRIVDTELPIRISPHGIDEPGRRNKYCVALTARNRQDRDVVAAEAGRWVQLLTLAQFLAQAKLAAFVVAPGEDLCEFSAGLCL